MKTKLIFTIITYRRRLHCWQVLMVWVLRVFAGSKRVGITSLSLLTAPKTIRKVGKCVCMSGRPTPAICHSHYSFCWSANGPRQSCFSLEKNNVIPGPSWYFRFLKRHWALDVESSWFSGLELSIPLHIWLVTEVLMNQESGGVLINVRFIAQCPYGFPRVLVDDSLIRTDKFRRLYVVRALTFSFLVRNVATSTLSASSSLLNLKQEDGIQECIVLGFRILCIKGNNYSKPLHGLSDPRFRLIMKTINNII